MVESHWVPVVYLKNFGFIPKSGKKSSRNRKIYYFSKSQVLKEGISNNTIQRLSLGEICMSDSFYSEKMEKYLNIKVETNVLNDAITKIISDKSSNTLENDQKQAIQQFVLTQIIRTPANIRVNLEMINWLKTLPKEIYDNSIQNYENSVPQENLPSTKEEYQKMLENNIYLASKYPDLLKDYKMQIWTNETNIHFYTSDNPVIDLTNFMFWNYKVFEIKSQYSHPIPKLILPISPRILILFEKAPEIKGMKHVQKRNVNDFKEVLRINNDIIRNAEETILMKSKNLNELKSVIKTNEKCLKKKHYTFKYLKPANKKLKINPLVEKSGDFACRYCGKRYKTMEGIQVHLEKYCKIKNRSK